MFADLNLSALAAAVFVAFGLLFGGHYAFRPPLPVIRPPWTYVYGVGACLLGVGFYALLSASWLIPFVVMLVVFGMSGAPVILFYRLDRRAYRNVDQEHDLADALEDVAHLQAEVSRLRQEGRDALR